MSNSLPRRPSCGPAPRRSPVTLLIGLALLLAATAVPAAADGAYVHEGPNLRAPGSVEALSGTRAGTPESIARDFLTERLGDLGLVDGDLAELEISSSNRSAHTRVGHVYFQQTRDGIPVFGAVANVNVAGDGRVLSLGNRLFPGLASSLNSAAPTFEASAAAESALRHLGHEASFIVQRSKDDARRHTLLDDAGIAGNDVGVKLTWLPVARFDVRLSWQVEVELVETSNWWQVFVDAHTGEVLHKVDLVVHDDFGPNPGGPIGKAGATAVGAKGTASKAQRGDEAPTPATKGDGAQYEVFEIPAEYPYEDNDPTTAADDVPPSDPDGGRSVVADPADATASPFGWHDTNGSAGAEFTITQGNNVNAYLDRTNSDSPDPGSQPDGGAGLDFTGALVPLDLINDGPTAYGPAAVVNLFYWNNIIHDVFYLYGFDEASGNFQENNYGNGGAGSDSVNAEAQDGSGTNNANFGTPSDGSNPRMQMYTWNSTTPNRDGDFSSMIITHEYGHGISNRLTGGRNDVGCLNNSEQMGEGWSDWLGLVLTANAGDSRTTQRGVGTYALGQPPDTGAGIRPAPYTTDFGLNAYTYGDTTSGLAVPHGIGFDWATITWEVYWDVVDEYGFNADVYGDWTTGGNNLMIQLVLDGMKLQPCSPGFVDGRDAILLADTNLTGGANQCLLWKAFARRGLGESANQGSTSSNSDNVEAFDVPVSCDYLGAAPESATICAGDDAIYDLTIGEAFTAPVTLSTIGAPAGTTSGFSPNPVPSAPGMSQLTLGSTGGLSAGTYGFDIHGDDTVETFDLGVELEVFDAAPGTVALSTPANGTPGVSINVTLTWTAAPGGGTYSVEVATDAAFTNVVDSATGLTSASYTVANALDSATTYYWRVAAENPCGAEPFSSPFSFTTATAPGDCPIGVVAETEVVEDFESGVGAWTSSAGVGSDTWALVSDNVHSGTNAFHADDVSEVSDQYLVSPQVTLPSSGFPITMRFWNYQEIEDQTGGDACYDGAVVEISTDGSTWTRLESELLTDPYDGPVSTSFDSPIEGENAWCGDPQDWLESAVEVDAWAGQTVQFRFRLATDLSVGHPGWWIDDFSIQSCPLDLFSDGFESGDTSAWTVTIP